MQATAKKKKFSKPLSPDCLSVLSESERIQSFGRPPAQPRSRPPLPVGVTRHRRSSSSGLPPPHGLRTVQTTVFRQSESAPCLSRSLRSNNRTHTNPDGSSRIFNIPKAGIPAIMTTFAARRACRDVPPLPREGERKVRATQSAALPNG